MFIYTPLYYLKNKGDKKRISVCIKNNYFYYDGRRKEKLEK